MLGANFRRFVYFHACPVLHTLCGSSEKNSHHGRRNGGVTVVVRNILMRFVKQIEDGYDNVIILEVSKKRLSTDANVLTSVLVNTY